MLRSVKFTTSWVVCITTSYKNISPEDLTENLKIETMSQRDTTKHPLSAAELVINECHCPVRQPIGVCLVVPRWLPISCFKLSESLTRHF